MFIKWVFLKLECCDGWLEQYKDRLSNEDFHWMVKAVSIVKRMRDSNLRWFSQVQTVSWFNLKVSKGTERGLMARSSKEGYDTGGDGEYNLRQDIIMKKDASSQL
jgi:hypothetical protein